MDLRKGSTVNNTGNNKNTEKRFVTLSCKYKLCKVHEGKRAQSEDSCKNSHLILTMMLGSHYTACEMLCDIFIR